MSHVWAKLDLNPHGAAAKDHLRCENLRMAAQHGLIEWVSWVTIGRRLCTLALGIMNILSKDFILFWSCTDWRTSKRVDPQVNNAVAACLPSREFFETWRSDDLSKQNPPPRGVNDPCPNATCIAILLLPYAKKCKLQKSFTLNASLSSSSL